MTKKCQRKGIPLQLFLQSIPYCIFFSASFYSVEMVSSELDNSRTLEKFPFLSRKLLYIYTKTFDEIPYVSDIFVNLKGIKDIYDIKGKRIKILHCTRNVKTEIKQDVITCSKKKRYLHMYSSFKKDPQKEAWGYAWVVYFRSCPEHIFTYEI